MLTDNVKALGYGVIGNTTDSGPVFPGSSPGTPTKRFLVDSAFLRSPFFVPVPLMLLPSLLNIHLHLSGVNLTLVLFLSFAWARASRLLPSEH